MKTRIFKTKLFEDPDFLDLSPEEKLIVLYLYVNPMNGLTRYTQIPTIFISISTGLDVKTIEEAKKNLSKFFLFYESWVYVVKDYMILEYKKGMNFKPYLKELQSVPLRVRQYFESITDTTIDTTMDTTMDSTMDTTMDSTMDTTMDSTNKLEIRNKKLEIKNKKSETKNQKQKNENQNLKIKNQKLETENKKLETENKKTKIVKENFEIQKEDLDLQNIVEHYNQVFKKKITSTEGFKNNYLFWSKIHDKEKIKLAISNAAQDRFWKDKLTLTILFRKKNPRGENVDYIEDLSSRTVSNIGNANNPFAVRAEPGKYDDLQFTVIDN